MKPYIAAGMDPLPANALIGRALDIAEKHLGIQELCHRLVVSEAIIRAWRFGHATMPEYKFQRLADILSELEPSWLDWDEVTPE